MDLCALHFSVTAAIEGHVRRRVRAAIGRAAGLVTDTTVRLFDINGTRKGVDKACRVVVGLPGRGTVAVEAVHRDLYAAIDVAAAKLRRALWRRLRRQRTLRREHALRRARRRAAAG